MGRYLLRRLLQLVPVFIGTTFLIYWLVVVGAGRPVRRQVRRASAAPTAYVNCMTEKFQLDQPLWVQYGNYMKNLFQGDFGRRSTAAGRRHHRHARTRTPLKLALVALPSRRSSASPPAS